jgi:lipocalin
MSPTSDYRSYDPLRHAKEAETKEGTWYEIIRTKTKLGLLASRRTAEMNKNNASSIKRGNYKIGHCGI